MSRSQFQWTWMPMAPPCTQHSTAPLAWGPGPSPSPPGTLPPPQTHQQRQVLKDPSSCGHEVPDAEHRAGGAGARVVAAALEICWVLGVQGIGPERGGPGSGQAGDTEGLRPARTLPPYLEKLNLLKVTVFLMNSVKFSAWTSRGFLWGRGQGGGGGAVSGRLCGPGAGMEDAGETYTGTAPLSTGHQPRISQVLWVPLNTTHWPVFMP